MIVWLASYPRSGNTFFRILLHSLAGIRTHSIYPVADGSRQDSRDTEILKSLVGQAENECDLERFRTDSEIHFVKTHDLPAEDKFPAVVLVRDGRDAIVSFAHFVLKTSKGIDTPTQNEFDETLEDLICGELFGGWSRNVSAWASRIGIENFVRYEELIKDPAGIMREALDRVSVRVDPDKHAHPNFAELSAQVPWFFRRGKPGAGAEEMPPRLQKLFWERHGEAMRRFGYLDSFAGQGAPFQGVSSRPSSAANTVIDLARPV